MQSATRQGPCGNPDCTDPTKPAGQWTLIPTGFTDKTRDGATCLCKKGACRRHYGLAPPLKKPGRKSSQLLDAPEASQQDSDCLPPPFTLAKIDELWGHRCQPPSCCTRAPRPRAIS